MADTHVVIRDEMGLRVPSIPAVTIAAADSITFKVDEGADSALYFSPHTASILSPRPEARVELAFGQTVTYTFAAPGHEAYGVIAQAPEDPAPEGFNFGLAATPPALVVQSGQGVDFPVATNTTQT
ncbi:MAG: hypothetical protein ABSG96_18460 [Terracidiphilus sp.]|jgi:hypothetical protein